jgi:uracil-DNA glycosylase
MHRQALGACRRCEHLPAHAGPVISGARRPVAMLVGQAPGKVETVDRRPFAGRAGRTLFSWFARAGFDESTVRDRVYISAMTRCYPGPHPSGRGDRVPNSHERATCGEWLEDELRLLQPPLLLLVGRLAIERFLPPAPLDRLVGTVVEAEHAGGRSRVIPLPHPSGASAWLNDAGHRVLVERAIDCISRELGPLIAGTPVARRRAG